MSKTKKIKKSRKIMRKIFKKDPDFKRTYIDNVSMNLYDLSEETNFSDKESRDKVAEGIIDLIFSK